jgi:hypothetical protein
VPLLGGKRVITKNRRLSVESHFLDCYRGSRDNFIKKSLAGKWSKLLLLLLLYLVSLIEFAL